MLSRGKNGEKSDVVKWCDPVSGKSVNVLKIVSRYKIGWNNNLLCQWENKTNPRIK